MKRLAEERATDSPGGRCFTLGAILTILIGTLNFPALCLGDVFSFLNPSEENNERVCCDFEGQDMVWHGSEPDITFEELAAYVAPILWFSPDEPLLEGKATADINIPEPFPFEEPADSPVVYYRIRGFMEKSGAKGFSYDLDPVSLGKSVLHLDKIIAIGLDYFFYYSSEEGVGRHPHDVESTEFKLEVIHNPDCESCRYAIVVQRIVAKAHGVRWYDNTLTADGNVVLPISILVEEGKHASCTDKNGDGVYTPGFDVNMRTNDAWGMRDIIRTGSLFSSSFQAWMAKNRTPATLVVPPLPEDSPLYEHFAQDDRDLLNKDRYKLRPFPSAEPARDDKRLWGMIDDKGYHDWPYTAQPMSLRKLQRSFIHEPFTRSFSFAYRYDGQSGLSIVFPLLIFKSVEAPIAGGWLLNRIYIKGSSPRDIGYNILYTPSASRWMDPYVSLGLEVEATEFAGDTDMDVRFSAETGLKFRANLGHTPLSFIRFLGTDFWGLRIGLQYVDFVTVEELRWVIEFGAGVW